MNFLIKFYLHSPFTKFITLGFKFFSVRIFKNFFTVPKANMLFERIKSYNFTVIMVKRDTIPNFFFSIWNYRYDDFT